MEEWQKRVIEEEKELNLKLAKLRIFINGSVFITVSCAERYRLQTQRLAMELYQEMLIQRITAFLGEGG